MTKKVFVIVTAASGHINPVTGVVKELIDREKCDVVFYGLEKYREIIEKSGAEYRPYQNLSEQFADVSSASKLKNFYFKIMRMSVIASDLVLPGLIEDVERDRPEMILFDFFAFHAKYLMEILHNKYEKKQSDYKPPKFVRISQTFSIKLDVYPIGDETKLLFKNTNFFWPFHMLLMILTQLMVSWKYGLSFVNPVDLIQKPSREIMTLTTVFPEFQPRADQFPSDFKFIGSCIEERVRFIEVKDKKFNKIFSEFESINPLQSVESFSNTKKKLILVSLGTIFNHNVDVFDKIIEAIQMLQHKYDLTVVFSVGKKSYEEYTERINSGEFKCPENVCILPQVPQVELLKKSSLFITHCGQNSASEAAHYGVPMIGLPVETDQPLVAHRLAKLKLALTFDPRNFQIKDLSDAIDTILSDCNYLKRSIEFSKLSRKYNGSVNGALELIRVLNSDVKKDI
jgi:UDP:flavonoid glycosyltransferase YjiC (YdhE family)